MLKGRHLQVNPTHFGKDKRASVPAQKSIDNKRASAPAKKSIDEEKKKVQLSSKDKTRVVSSRRWANVVGESSKYGERGIDQDPYMRIELLSRCWNKMRKVKSKNGCLDLWWFVLWGISLKDALQH